MKKLVGYITSKLPNNNFTVDLANAMLENGVDYLELGIPFSDPVADGPVIQKANDLSLKNDFKLKDLFEISTNIKKSDSLYWMGYFNSFYNYGIKEISEKASLIGTKGFLIPDLPLEESKAYNEIFETNNLDLVTFVAPTDTEERIKQLVSNSRGFIYLVAYAGITGSGKAEDLTETIENIRKYSKTPIYIGFGVNKETAKEKAAMADGVIVGSAFVNILLDETLTNSKKIDNIASLSREIKDRMNS